MLIECGERPVFNEVIARGLGANDAAEPLLSVAARLGLATTGVSAIGPRSPRCWPLFGETRLDGEACDRFVQKAMVVHKVAVASELQPPVGTVSASARRSFPVQTTALRARIKRFLGFGQVDLGPHVAGLGDREQARERVTSTRTVYVESQPGFYGQIADVKVQGRYVVLRKKCKKPASYRSCCTVKSDPADALSRGRWRLDQIARLRLAPPHHTQSKGADLRIAKQSLDLLDARAG